MIQDTIAEKFFDDYRRALLGRDASAIAAYYAVPALIEFPDQRPGHRRPQTEEFFAGAFGQYEGVSRADAAVKVLAQTGHNLWADVTWSYDGHAPQERNLYQLLRPAGDWKIAVLTSLGA